MGQVILFIYLLFSFSADESIIDRVNNYCKEKKGKTYDEILFVSVKEQMMYHIVENTIVTIVFNADEPIEVRIPQHMNLKVIETDGLVTKYYF